jgi:NTP pyrophosphatase (non-canonical NTP hydrolase)
VPDRKMNLDDYQEKAASTDIMSDGLGSVDATNPAYIAKILGLSGEAGEVAEKYKKIIRDKSGIVSEEDRQEIAKELGDVLWYVAMIAKYLGVSLSEVAQMNVDKLQSRKERRVIQSKGDNR